jgi:hypothetical protein
MINPKNLLADTPNTQFKGFILTHTGASFQEISVNQLNDYPCYPINDDIININF